MPSEKRTRQRAARAAKLEELARQRKRRQTRNRAGGAVVVVVLLVGGYLVFFNSSTNSPKKSATASTTTTSTTSATTTTAASTSTTVAVPAPVTAITQAQADQAAVAAGCASSPSAKLTKPSWGSPPAMAISTSKSYSATIQTDIGSITIALDAKDAPSTVNNFVFLADRGFYNCIIFHRVIPQFMDQTGDPTGTGSGGPGYKFDDENLPSSAAASSGTAYAPGVVAMANSGANTDGSQFFIMADSYQLGPSYSIFGHVTSGLNVVERINADGSSSGTPTITHRMLKVTISSS